MKTKLLAFLLLGGASLFARSHVFIGFGVGYPGYYAPAPIAVYAPPPPVIASAPPLLTPAGRARAARAPTPPQASPAGRQPPAGNGRSSPAPAARSSNGARKSGPASRMAQARTRPHTPRQTVSPPRMPPKGPH